MLKSATAAVSTAVYYLFLVVLFTLTGAWSAWLCHGTIKPDQNDLILIPLPFAVPAAFLFLRSWRAILAVPLFVLVWIMARGAADWGYFLIFPDHSAMHVGGLIGGLGLALVCVIGRPRILRFRYLASAAPIGYLAALPFQHFLDSNHGAQGNGLGWEYHELLLGFAVWQVLVGTYLYWACDRCRDRG